MAAARAARIASAAGTGEVVTLTGTGTVLRVTATLTLSGTAVTAAGAVLAVAAAEQTFEIGWAIGTVAEEKISDIQRGLKQYDKEEPIWVVRAGVATSEQLKTGSKLHRGVPGLFGFSVQSAPGKTIEELAAAGQFRHGQISVTTVDALLAVGVPIVKSPGTGYHNTARTEYPLTDLKAKLISAVFKPRPNPAQVK